MGDAFQIAEVRPLAAVAIFASDFKAPVAIFGNGPKLGICATGAITSKPEPAGQRIPDRSTEVGMKIVLSGSFDGGEIFRTAEGFGGPEILGSNRRGKRQCCQPEYQPSCSARFEKGQSDPDANREFGKTA